MLEEMIFFNNQVKIEKSMFESKSARLCTMYMYLVPCDGRKLNLDYPRRYVTLETKTYSVNTVKCI